MFKHIPNILTIVRFLLIPIIVMFAFEDNYIATIIMLTISGLTDVLDGYIARKFNFISNFGKLMDPLADKMTQVALLGTLAIQKIIPVWIIVVVIIKEFLMVSGASFLYGKELVVSSKWYGKLTTVLFYVAIVCSLFTEYWNGTLIGHPEYSLPKLPEFDTYIYYLAVITTIFSLIMYIKAFYMQGYLKNALEQENNETDKKTDA
ncbi:MAG: CDP-diacylglycerol--glycerol-3-phosphate 3-phosphatidyltransferase [Clostridia bacterium]|nr:CDP-diacylglycerol--glycerol-3-phosphate 3-phosphatidyltransferase [Clostridia bacterium]